MPEIALIKAFLEKATVEGTRTTVLKPLAWLIALLVGATIGAFSTPTPNWIGVAFAILVIALTLLYTLAYGYCLFTDKDALRSETYSIQKLAIEKGYVGDNIMGSLMPTQPIAGTLEQKAVDASGVEQ